MRVLLLVALITILTRGANARPSNYFYRISPAGVPLKREPALYAKQPEYPQEARRRHLTGSGLFGLHVRSDGHVHRVEILKSIGHAVLDRAAIAAFRDWRFAPGSIKLVRVPIRYVHGVPPTESLYRRPLKKLGDGVQITVFSE